MNRFLSLTKKQPLFYLVLLLGIVWLAVWAISGTSRAANSETAVALAEAADNQTTIAQQDPLLQTTNSFSSGSDGSDGALILTTPGTYIFKPGEFNPPLDPDGDNVYHFTDITIGPDVTIQLSGQYVTGPVYWLASGAVQIDGLIDLRGENGHLNTVSLAERRPAIPGAGGYYGGVGHLSSRVPQPGLGPGGGYAEFATTGAPHYYCTGNAGLGSHATVAGGDRINRPYGNSYLVPLLGGSGGGGGYDSPIDCAGYGGGAGGGALLIASSANITINGTINANGGAGGAGSSGSGSGGAIHLLAPGISGSGSLLAQGVSNGSHVSGAGRIRLDTFTNNFTGTVNPTPVMGTPFQAFLPTALPSVRVVRINGVPVPDTPEAALNQPDVTIDADTPVTIAVEAQNVPTGYVVQLYIYSEMAGDQIIQSEPLTGTLALSTATVVATLPMGPTRMFVRVDWADQFQYQRFYPANDKPASLITADFNNDGFADLAVTNDYTSSSASMTILYGDGHGAFAPGPSYSVAPDSVTLVAADFNGDGNMDMAVAKRHETDSITIRLGNGDGTFQSPQSYSPGTESINHIVAADFNGDQHLDLAGVDFHGSGRVTVLLGNGDGTFSAYQHYPVAVWSGGIAVGDLNNDSFLDIVTTATMDPWNNFRSAISIIYGNGDGSFQPPVSPGAFDRPSVRIADANNDGNNDLFVGSTSGIYLLLGAGNGVFQSPRLLLNFNTYSSASWTVAEVTTDNHVDVIVFYEDQVVIYPGNGDGTFPVANSRFYQVGDGGGGFVAEDFNGDGLIDMAAANYNWGSISIFIRQ